MLVRIGCVLSLSLGVLIHAVPVVGQQAAIDSNTEMLIRLLSPVSTANAKGDKITAQVIAPEKFQGDFLEGTITASKSSGKVNGTSKLNFTFHILHHGDTAIPIRTIIKTVSNSRGKVGVDEEGQVIRRTDNRKKIVIGSIIGAGIGYAAGGATGAVIGGGAGAAAALIVTQFAVKGPRISFAPLSSSGTLDHTLRRDRGL